MASGFRSLSGAEIAQLQEQGCTCDNWSSIKVAQKFNPERVRSTHFSGDIQIGALEKTIRFYGGLTKPAGISNATIHNCRIGDNVYIHNVLSHIANYVIEDDCVIEHIDLLAVQGQSSFGNGTEAVVINEAGGREVPIYDHLTAQIAYIIALYRHRPKVTKALQKMIADYTKSVTSSMGVIGAGARLYNCGTLKNVRVGPCAVIGNVKRLENGTISSCAQDPTEVGANVIARNFILCSGAKVGENSIISDCFIGQATELAKQYSAENSVFFANCGCYHGEACSIFAGPYTVTHHKATLLIAGMFSFFNAGSSSNQSNHMYKAGPVHQAVCERGAKTSSDSYILYPARIGAFSVVMGRHYAHPDTSDIPFSYIFEENGKSFIVPGVNLRTVGTVRDAQKWPRRDKRKDPNKNDLIVFNVLSPFTAQKIINGRSLLLNLRPAHSSGSDVVVCNHVHFRVQSLQKGIQYYQLAITKYLGDCLVQRLRNKAVNSEEELRKVLKPDTQIGRGKWLDMAGLLVPEECVEEFLKEIEDGGFSSLEQLTERLGAFYDNYTEYEWAWAVKNLENILEKSIEQVTGQDIAELIRQWKEAAEKLNALILEDARKEFNDVSMIGYGLDGDQQVKEADFRMVRGSYENNSFVTSVEKDTAEKSKIAEELAAKITKLTQCK